MMPVGEWEVGGREDGGGGGGEGEPTHDWALGSGQLEKGGIGDS